MLVFMARSGVCSISEALALSMDYLVKVADYLKQQEAQAEAASKTGRR